MNFGNWDVTEKGISWKGSPLQKFEIPANKLTATRQGGEDGFYEWILLATDQDWLAQNDLYDLNFAFVYTAAKLNLDFNYDIFDATLDEQYDQFEEEDDEDDE
ncbi:MAG TPA: hypothetical protein VF623_02830 [Segetibacter sp.]|jgi:hypothetical protein